MLILTRKLDEGIKLGDDITIIIIEVHGKHVKLGIDAPQNVKIYRKEIYDKVMSENIRSATATVEDFKGIKEQFK